MRIKLTISVSILLVVMGVTSCKISTPRLKRTMTMPVSYQKSASDTSTTLPAWHIFYRDTLLTNLLEEALAHNLDVVTAAEGVNLAGSEYKIVGKNFLPSIEALLGNTTRKFGEYTMDDIGNKDTNKSDNVPPDKHIPSPYTQWFAGVVFQWEADLWGKLSSRRKAAAARYLASTEFQRALSTLVISEVATAYFELMGLDQEKKVLHQNLQLQELGFELIKIQKVGGKVNQLAVDQFEAQLLDTKNRIMEVNQQITVTEARINELLGRFPQRIVRDSVSNYPELLQLRTGKPEALLSRRPDIREAELKLAEAHWDVNAAKAAFYPSLGFSADLGLSSFDASKLFNMPGSVAYSLTSGLTTPIFKRNEIRAQYAAASSRQKIALANYEKKILESYYEVYRTLAAVNTLEQQIQIKNSEVDILHRAFNNSNDLFSVGYATYLEVITAQRRMLEAELNLTRLRKNSLKSRAVLYRALGGGWKNQ